MKEEYPYQVDWEKYKFWQKIFWILAVPAFSTLVFLLFRSLNGGSFEAFSGWSAIVFNLLGVFVLAESFVSVRLQFWKCPRCKDSFHGGFWWPNMLSRKCRSCQLRKYEGSTFGPAR
jgi:hypothetical protein